MFSTSTFNKLSIEILQLQENIIKYISIREAFQKLSIRIIVKWSKHIPEKQPYPFTLLYPLSEHSIEKVSNFKDGPDPDILGQWTHWELEIAFKTLFSMVGGEWGILVDKSSKGVFYLLICSLILTPYSHLWKMLII